MSPRVLALARVSGSSQASDGTSLESQAEAFAAYCRALSLPAPIVHVEVESGGADRQEHRAEVERLIRDACPGDTIIVNKVDRWSRNLPWGIASVRALVKRGVGWRSIGEGIDATTPNGDFVLGIMLAVADQERQRIKERTVGARRRLREQGFHVEGLAPLGYRVVDRRLVVEDAGASIVRMMYALCLAGRSTRELAVEVRAAFPSVRGIDHATVARMLRDRRYLGESCSRGSRQRRKSDGTWRATHDAIVDADTWHRAQAALTARTVGGRRVQGDSRTAGYLLRGVLLCGHCGRIMSSHRPSDDGPGYYVCAGRVRRGGGERCAGPIVRQEHADRDVERLALEQLTHLRALLARPAERRPPPTLDLDAERDRLLRRRARVVEAVAAGAISFDAARETMAGLEASLAAVDGKRAATAVPAVDRTAVLGQVSALERAWVAMATAERREALRSLADRIETHSTATQRWQRGAWTLTVHWHSWD